MADVILGNVRIHLKILNWALLETVITNLTNPRVTIFNGIVTFLKKKTPF